MKTINGSIYTPLKVYLLYAFFLVSNLAGRELVSVDIIGITNIKIHHVFFILFSFINIELYFKHFPYKKLFYGILFLSLIPFYKGMVAGHEGVFNFLAVDFTLVFFLWGYFYLKDEKDILFFLKFLVFCFILTYIIKEFLFLKTGHSILFSFSDLRIEERIRQSSDTINSLALISLIIILLSDTSNLKKYSLAILITYIIFRYGIRGSFISIFLVGLYHFMINKKALINHFLSKYYKAITLILLIALILFLMYFLDFTKKIILNFIYSGADQYGTFSWRLAVWFDNITSYIKNGSILIGTSGLPIQYILTRYIGFRGYVNPHNSNIFLLINYGLIFLIMYLIVPLNLLFEKRSRYDNKTLYTMKLIVIVLLGLSLTTAIYELPYQGSIFWFIVGGAYRILENNSNITNNDPASTLS